MHRIDAPGATPDKKFTLGNGSLGIPATTIDDAWCNAIQEELASFIESCGISLAKGNWSQLAQAISVATQNLAHKAITLNYNGGVNSAGDAGLQVRENSTVTGYVKVAADRSKWTLKAPGSTAVMTIGAGIETLDPGGDSFWKPSADGSAWTGKAPGATMVGKLFPNELGSFAPFVEAVAYTSLNDAISTLGSAEATLVIRKPFSVTASLTVPANITLQFMNGGSLTATSAVTLTLSGAIAAGSFSIFGANISLAGKPKQERFDIRWFGATGDNTTNDSAAFSRAFGAMNAFSASPTLVIPSGTYVLESSPTALSKGCRIVGNGIDTVLKPVTGVRAIQINDKQATIENICFFGSGTRAGTGVYIDQRSVNLSVIVNNCRFANLDSGVFLFGESASQIAHQGAILHGLEMKNCTYGIHLATRAEYVNVVACDINGCAWGIYDVAGNLHVSGSNLSDNTIGIELVAGDNDSHGAVVGTAINHCSSYGIKAGALSAKSHKFVGCDIIASNMLFTGTRGLLVQGCQLTSSNFYFDGADGVTFKDCIVDAALLSKITPALNSHQSYFNFIGCRDLDGKSAQAFYAFNGGIVYFVPSTTQTIANGASAKMQFSVSSQATPYNTNQTKYALTSGSPPDTFVNQSLGNGVITVNLNARLIYNASITSWSSVWASIKVGTRMVAIVPVQLAKTASATIPFLLWAGSIRASAGDNVSIEIYNYSGYTVQLDGNGTWECSVEGL